MNEQSIYGIHAVTAVLSNQQRHVVRIFLCEDRQDKRMKRIEELALQRQVPVVKLNRQELTKRFPEHHQGVVAIADKAIEYTEKELPDLISTSHLPLFILILDGVTDPHNLGACLRTAEAAGVDFVLVPKDNSVNLTSTVSKVACGAAEIIPLVRVTNLARAITLLQQQGVWVYGAAAEADELIYQIDFTCSVAMVLGAEGKGMRRLTREKCDNLFALPMLGQTESLNVSVATGICLYEVVRQRRPLS